MTAPSEQAAAKRVNSRSPMVSVMMVTHQHDKYIAQAVESVLQQVTTLDVELVVGDDASTDQTPAILRDFATRFPDRVRLVTQRRNVGVARNALSVIRACRGKYIALLDGDDYWTDPGKLQAQVDLLESMPDAVLCGARALVWREGESQPDNVAPEGDTATLASYGARELVLGHWYFRTCTVVVPRHRIENIPMRFAGDWSATLWLLGNHPGGRVGFVDRVVGVYRVHRDGAYSGAPEHTRNARDVRTICRVLPLFQGEQREHLVRQLFARLDALIADRAVSTGTLVTAALRALRRCYRTREAWHVAARVARTLPRT